MLSGCSNCFSLCSLLVLSFIDVFKSEMWSEFFSSIPEVLQPTASLVKSNVLASKADGTVRFKRWKCWASSNHVYHFPPNPFQIAVYLQCLFNEAYSPSPVLNVVYTIDWALQLAGLSKISSHPLVASMVSASTQRILGRPKVKKDPITPEILKALVEWKITDKSPSICDLRYVFLYLFHRLFLVCTFVVVELACSINARRASSEHAIAYRVSLLLSRTGMVSIGNLDESWNSLSFLYSSSSDFSLAFPIFVFFSLGLV